MTYSAEQLKAMCPAQISECSQKHVQSVIAELIETAQAQPASVPAWRSQHDADSAELRRLCKARDDARRERDALRAELAGMEAGSGHLSALVDDLRGLLAESMRVMKALHESATPDDGPEMNAVIPASAFHQFVDDNAKLMHQIHVSPHELPSAPQAPQPAHAAPQPEAQPTFSIPPEIAKIIESLHTQDNRITANPLFAVQQKRVIGGLESGYEDGWAWVDYDGEIHDADRISELNARFQDGESEPDGCRRVGYIEKWEFVTGCLTEEGCKQYLRLDGHNLREPRIYAYGGYRNVELEALRKWLMSLRAAPSAQAEPTACQHAGQCHPGFCQCSDAKRMAEQKGGE